MDMKKQLLLVVVLLFTAIAYAQISPDQGIRVRTVTRTESNRSDISTIAVVGSQAPTKARGGKTDRMKAKEGCSASGKTRGAGLNGGVKTGVRANSGIGSKLSRPNIGINNRGTALNL